MAQNAHNNNNGNGRRPTWKTGWIHVVNESIGLGLREAYESKMEESRINSEALREKKDSLMIKNDAQRLENGQLRDEKDKAIEKTQLLRTEISNMRRHNAELAMHFF